MNDTSKPLHVYLADVTGERITADMVQAAVGMTRATFYRKIDGIERAGIIITAARAFGAAPLPALIDLGVISEDELAQALSDPMASLQEATDVELSAEILRRLQVASEEHPVLEAPYDSNHPAWAALDKAEQEDSGDAEVVRLERKNPEPKPWDNAPTYDPNEEIDFTTYDAASHGPKEQIPDWEGDYS